MSELNETHEQAKNAGNCYICGGSFFVKEKIVTWEHFYDSRNNLIRVAAHEKCFAEIMNEK